MVSFGLYCTLVQTHAYILIFILSLAKIIVCVSSFLNQVWCEFLAQECLVLAKLYKQLEELKASRKWVVDATK